MHLNMVQKIFCRCASLVSEACIIVVSVTHSENKEHQKYFWNVVVVQGKKPIRDEKTKLQATMGIITLGFVASLHVLSFDAIGNNKRNMPN